MTLLQLLETFCTESIHLRGVTSQTTKRYKENIGFFCKHTNIIYPQDIKRDIVLSFFLHGRCERNWTASTFHTYYMSLRVFFTWLKNMNFLQENITDGMKLPRIPRSLPKSLSQEETQLLLTQTYNYPWKSSFVQLRNYAMISTYIFTGVRRSELLNLCEHDINFEQGLLRVNKGKGNKDRVIPINTTLMNTLNRCIEIKHQRKYTSPNLFCTDKRDDALSHGGLKKTMEKLREITGLKIGNHILRHTFAILMLQGGCDIVSLSKMLGHSDVKTTMRYLLIDDEHLKTQMAKHPLDGSQINGFHGGAINHHFNQQYSSHGFQRPQEHHVLRNDQLAQQQHSVWNKNATGHSVPRYGGR
ncbi:tyrosine-type recombinase/integrase [Psychroserpens sp.]|uniref:tyrosine-type recombinase/integrase n=1 Tax=Psychroserpens sp. TaxID=2020870 RepID=UPI002B274F70|nr:tyrosine-type recombinase/integrase [Psychroserpens sp.]